MKETKQRRTVKNRMFFQKKKRYLQKACKQQKKEREQTREKSEKQRKNKKKNKINEVTHCCLKEFKKSMKKKKLK